MNTAQTVVLEKTGEARTLTVTVSSYGWSFAPDAGQVGILTVNPVVGRDYIVLSFDELEEIVRAVHKARRADRV